MTHYTEKSGDPREPAWISDKTKIKISIAGVVAICLTIMSSTWVARGYVEAFKQDLAAHFTALQASQDSIASDLKDTKNSLGYKWTTGQMAAWASQLDKSNRVLQRKDGTTGLDVPDVLSVRSATTPP